MISFITLKLQLIIYALCHGILSDLSLLLDAGGFGFTKQKNVKMDEKTLLNVLIIGPSTVKENQGPKEFGPSLTKDQ
jgi:hypothetical protein